MWPPPDPSTPPPTPSQAPLGDQRSTTPSPSAATTVGALVAIVGICVTALFITAVLVLILDCGSDAGAAVALVVVPGALLGGSLFLLRTVWAGRTWVLIGALVPISVTAFLVVWSWLSILGENTTGDCV